MVVTRLRKHQKRKPSTQTTQRESKSKDKRNRRTNRLQRGRENDTNSLIGVGCNEEGEAKDNVTLSDKSQYEQETTAEDEVTSSTGAESKNKGCPQDDAESCTHAKSNKEGPAKHNATFLSNHAVPTEEEVTSSTGTAWSKRKLKYGGLFRAPLSQTIRDKYRHNDVAVRKNGTTEEIPVYDATAANQVLLKVGMDMFTDFMQGVGRFKKYTIVEFTRGHITLSPILVLPMADLNLDSDLNLRYQHPQTGTAVRINDEDEIFVIQNPAVTARLKNAENDRRKSRYESNAERLQHLEVEYGMSVEQHKYYLEHGNICDVTDAYKYSILPLNHLPTSQAPKYCRSDFDKTGYTTKCFLCDTRNIWKLKHGAKGCKTEPDMRENCVANLMKGTQHRGVHESLNTHCKNNDHEMFYFLAREINRPPSTYVQIQKSMIAGLETCGGVIPYPLILSAMSGDQTLFKIELAKIFGAALNHNRSGELTRFKRLKSMDRGDISKDEFKAFKAYCETTLNNILHSLLEFDWMSFKDQNVKPTQVWNAINLYLRQGMFFDDIFPPTMHVQCNDVLSKDIKVLW